ncbi:MAG TPA: hypothetical protein VGT08_15800 [Terracidiphilus sp.]|nr:hypothetical protein [Terracidiphilus sp.]
MDDLPDALNRLMTRLEALEQRVYVLEHPAGAPIPLPVQKPGPLPAVQAGEMSSVSLTGGVFSVLGKAMLGIAGAYLLRAVAESSSLPKTAVAAVAIAYALVWLVWASRAKAGDWLAGTTYACTSALILAPMLWELTLRFRVLPAPLTAGVVIGFEIAASALAWKRNFAPVLWVANVAAVAIALGLAITSHQMAPFIAVLLVMVVIEEYRAGLNKEIGVRVLVALASDVAIWALIYIYSSPQSTRGDYPTLGPATLLAPGLGLFLIFGASLIYMTVLKEKTITVFETIQTMIAFLLAACSLIYFGPPVSTTALGIFCVALSGVSYAAAFVHFDRAAEGRNYLVFATWSAALFLAGSLLCLPTLWQAPWLSSAAVAATFAGARLRRLALELHGAVFLLAAATISGLLNHIFSALAGTPPGAPGWSIYLVSACTVLCYAVMKPCPDESWRQQFLSIVFAALAIGAAAALLVEGLVGLVALGIITGAHHLAFIRTFTLCATAIALAFSGSRWRRIELTRIGYATLALLAVKLVLEDLRNGHLEFIAASIFLFAITLIVVPRVARLVPKD